LIPVYEPLFEKPAIIKSGGGEFEIDGFRGCHP